MDVLSFLFGVCILLIGTDQSNALTCYACLGDASSTCAADPFDGGASGVSQTTTDLSAGHGGACVVCYKGIFTNGGAVRGCHDYYKAIGCLENTVVDTLSYLDACACDDNLCNGSSNLIVSMSLLFFMYVLNKLCINIT